MTSIGIDDGLLKESYHLISYLAQNALIIKTSLAGAVNLSKDWVALPYSSSFWRGNLM